MENLDRLREYEKDGFLVVRIARSRSNPDQVDSWEAWKVKRAAAIAAAQSRRAPSA